MNMLSRFFFYVKLSHLFTEKKGVTKKKEITSNKKNINKKKRLS